MSLIAIREIKFSRKIHEFTVVTCNKILRQPANDNIRESYDTNYHHWYRLLLMGDVRGHILVG